jgi:hypothetical protein
MKSHQLMMTCHTKEIDMAKAITPKEAANLLTRKRGRPVGSKNKKNPIYSFKKTLDEWDRIEAEISRVDLKNLTEKLQDALAKSYCENQQLEKTNKALINEMNRQSCIIDYLENRSK